MVKRMAINKPKQILDNKIWKNWEVCISDLDPFKDDVEDFKAKALLKGLDIASAIYDPSRHESSYVASIKGAYVSGDLNLNGLSIKIELRFVNCVFESNFSIKNADLLALKFENCKINSVFAGSTIFNSGFEVRNCEFLGVIVVLRARFGDYFTIEDSSFKYSKTNFLSVNRSIVNGNLTLRKVHCPEGVFSCIGIKVGGHFKVVDSGVNSLLCQRIEVGNNLVFSNVKIGTSIDVDYSKIYGSFGLFGVGFVESIDEERTAITGAGVDVGGQFVLSGLRNFPKDINFRRAMLRDGVVLKNIEAKHQDGGGAGVFFDGAEVNGNLEVVGDFDLGTKISFLGVLINGNLKVNCHMKKGEVIADDVVVGGSVFLTRRLRCLGKISIDGAKISNNLSVVGAEIYKLFARNVKVSNLLTLSSLKGDKHELNFANTSVRVLHDSIDSWGVNFNIDGFEYESFADVKSMNVDSRLRWMESAMINRNRDSFSSQPWKMLQTVLRNAGHNSAAAKVGYVYENKLLANGSFNFFGKIAHYLYGVFTGYGYRCMRLLWWSLGVWLVFGFFYWYVASQHAVFSPTNPLVFKREMYPGCFSDVAVDVNNRASHLDRIKFEKFSALYYLNFLGDTPYGGVSVGISDAEKMKFGLANDLVDLPVVDYVKSSGGSEIKDNWYYCAALPSEYTALSPLAYSLDVVLPIVDLQQQKDWAPMTPTPKSGFFEEIMDFSWQHATRMAVWVETLFGWLLSSFLLAILSGMVRKND